MEGRRADGTVFPMHLAVGEAEIDGERRYVGFVSDITRRKEAEAAIINAKEEAERASRLKTEFLNVMSHELRTPLTVILGITKPLKSLGTLPNVKRAGVDVPEVVSMEVTRLVEMTERNGKHLQVMINDILDLSKIEAGKLKVSRERIGAAEAVGDALAAVSHWAEERGVALVSDVADGLATSADRTRLSQILNNLLSNAIKYTEAGGTITVSAKPDGGMVAFSVADTGAGIPSDDLPFIFDAFRQVDSSERRSKGGTGLGLAIVRRLVEIHGGETTVESVVGQGTVFRFTMPAGGSAWA